MILYADISTLIDMSIFTGIQRVTVEILSRVISNTTWCVQNKITFLILESLYTTVSERWMNE